MKRDRAKEAYEMMADWRTNCAQAVFSSFCKEYGLSDNLALSLAQGLGGGMGHTGRTCGAVSGAYLVLGLAQKTTNGNPRENVDKTYQLIADFDKKFKALHGSTNCTGLTGYNLGVPEEAAKAREKGVFNNVCPGLVQDSVKILEGLLRL
jgi:C_GCAxxG_C_C family probable redox protein